MHHNLVTAIFISTINSNITSGIKHYTRSYNHTILNSCDHQKSCLEFYDPQAPLSEFIFIHNITLGVIGLFGIFGNILSIIVLSKPEMKSSINYLLIGLAYCDTFVVFFAIFTAILGSIFQNTGYFFYFNFFLLPYIYIYVQPLWYTAQVASVYLTIAIGLERYIAVCHPFRAKDICTIGKTKQCIYIIVMLSFLYHIPTYWENGIVQIVHDECNITVMCAYSTDFSKNNVYFMVYWEWLHSILTFLIPFTCLAFFNIRIFIQIEKAKRTRMKIAGCHKNDKEQTRILFYIVAVFFACNSIFPISYIYQYFFDMEMNLTHTIINQLAMSLFVLNSCVNFLIYIMVGKKFKKVFKSIFRSTETRSVETVRFIT